MSDPSQFTEEQKAQRITELEGLLAKSEGDKVGLVDELKELRKKRESVPVDDVDSKVRTILAEKEKQDATKNKDKALELFQEKNKEFHPDNDATGVKLGLLLSQVPSFNTSGFVSVEDFFKVYQKAKKLLENDKREAEGANPDAAEPISSNEPPSTDPNRLTPKEQRLIQSIGWTPERYLKNKSKDPAFVEQMLKQAP